MGSTRQSPVWVLLASAGQVATTSKPSIAHVRVLPTPEKVALAAANAAKCLKKRDVATAKLFLLVDAEGSACLEPREIAHSSDIQDLIGILVFSEAHGEFPQDCSAVVREMQAVRAVRLQQRAREGEKAAKRQHAAERAEESPSVWALPVLFWKHTDDNGYFSKFANSPFTSQGCEYCCAEQFIMHSKALLMNDLASAQKIM